MKTIQLQTKLNIAVMLFCLAYLQIVISFNFCFNITQKQHVVNALKFSTKNSHHTLSLIKIQHMRI